MQTEAGLWLWIPALLVGVGLTAWISGQELERLAVGEALQKHEKIVTKDKSR